MTTYALESCAVNKVVFILAGIDEKRYWFESNHKLG